MGVARLIDPDTGRELALTEEQVLSLSDSGLIEPVPGRPGLVRPTPKTNFTEVQESAAQLAGGPVCDFCGSAEVAYIYPARDAPLGTDPITGRVQMSAGAWTACEDCHRLIASGDRDGLARRCARLIGQSTGLALNRQERRSLAAEIRRGHEQFWRNRTGDPLPYPRL